MARPTVLRPYGDTHTDSPSIRSRYTPFRPRTKARPDPQFLLYAIISNVRSSLVVIVVFPRAFVHHSCSGTRGGSGAAILGGYREDQTLLVCG